MDVEDNDHSEVMDLDPLFPSSESKKTANKTKSKGQFFVVSLEAIQDIVRFGGLAEEVMSYLVLARHTQGRGEWQRLSTSGAKAIHMKTGIPYRKAVACLTWLEQYHFIVDTTTSPPGHFPAFLGKVQTRATTPRWWLKEAGEPLIYLANALIDGTSGVGRQHPPLMRLIDHLPISPYKKAESRLDTLLLLLHLYYHHALDEYGGVDPCKTVFTQWKRVSDEGWDKMDLAPLINATIQRENDSMWPNFADDVLFYIPDKALSEARFWQALTNLKTLGFLYAVVQIWDSDPFTVKGAEMLFPLYLFDRHARQSESYLAKSLHEIFIQLGVVPRGLIEHFLDEVNAAGLLRYFAPKEHYPLGVYRLRFRPKVLATGRWLKSEADKVNAWEAELKGLLYRLFR